MLSLSFSFIPRQARQQIHLFINTCCRSWGNMPEEDIAIIEPPMFQRYLAMVLQDVAVVKGVQNDIHTLSNMYKLMQKTCPMLVLTGELCDDCRSFMQEKVIQLRMDRRVDVS